MNPVVVEIGPLVLRSYAAWLLGGALLGLLVLAWTANEVAPGRVLRWLDVGLAALLAGVIGARLLYVALEWDRFRDQGTGDILRFASGGLMWHGALIAALPAALLAARLRGLGWRELRAWTDAAVLALPLLLGAGWLACRGNGCAYGYEVATLADWPGWLVQELPDIYGLDAPRLDVQLGGALWAGALLALALLLTVGGWLPGLRLWLILALTGLGSALLGFFRADPAPTLFDRRADQVLDLALLLLSTLIGSALWLWDRPHAAWPAPNTAPTHPDSPSETEIAPDERHDWTGSDQPEAGR